MTAALIGLGYAVVFIVALALVLILCRAAAKSDDVARRMLGPSSSDRLSRTVLTGGRTRSRRERWCRNQKKAAAELPTPGRVTNRGEVDGPAE